MSWSYLVLTSRSRASDFLLVLSKLSAGQQVSILRFVKVVTLGDVQPRKTRWEELTGEHPFQMLLRCLPKVSHIHLGSHLEPTQSSLLVTLANTTAPLEGLTGLVVAGVNLEAVTVALRHLAPSLRRLAVFGHDTRRPLFVGETFDDHSTLDFTSLVSITSGTSAATAQPWLGRLLAARWKMPLVRKLAIGTGAMDAKQAVGPHKWAFGLKSTAIISIHLPSLTDVGDGFPELGKVKVQELSITLRTGDPSAPPLDEFRIALDKAEGGRVDTVTSVVVVESRSASLPAYDRGLNLLVVELISRKRLPSLEKVVWVSKLKGDDGAEWSGSVGSCSRTDHRSSGLTVSCPSPDFIPACSSSGATLSSKRASTSTSSRRLGQSLSPSHRAISILALKTCSSVPPR